MTFGTLAPSIMLDIMNGREYTQVLGWVSAPWIGPKPVFQARSETAIPTMYSG